MAKGAYSTTQCAWQATRTAERVGCMDLGSLHLFIVHNTRLGRSAASCAAWCDPQEFAHLQARLQQSAEDCMGALLDVLHGTHRHAVRHVPHRICNPSTQRDMRATAALSK